MMNSAIITSLILGAGALGAGLGALQLNLLNLLGLSPLSRALKLICGAAGLFSLYGVMTQYDMIKAANTPMQLTAIFILIITNIGIGISGCGGNVVRALNMEGIKKPLQLIAGVVGVYSLAMAIQVAMQ